MSFAASKFLDVEAGADDMSDDAKADMPLYGGEVDEKGNLKDFVVIGLCSYMA
jgi:hypothetical protein